MSVLLAVSVAFANRADLESDTGIGIAGRFRSDTLHKQLQPTPSVPFLPTFSFIPSGP